MIHESANIYESAIIGEGTKVGAFAEIGNKVKIGKNCSIGFGVFIPENVIVEDAVFIGPGTVFTNDKYAPSKGKWRNEPPTIVKSGVTIGANSSTGYVSANMRLGYFSAYNISLTDEQIIKNYNALKTRFGL